MRRALGVLAVVLCSLAEAFGQSGFGVSYPPTPTAEDGCVPFYADGVLSCVPGLKFNNSTGCIEIGAARLCPAYAVFDTVDGDTRITIPCNSTEPDPPDANNLGIYCRDDNSDGTPELLIQDSLGTESKFLAAVAGADEGAVAQFDASGKLAEGPILTFDPGDLVAGDLIYVNSPGHFSRLAGNTTSDVQVLFSVGVSDVATAPYFAPPLTIATVFRGDGTTTDAVDLATAEVAGTLPDANVSDTLTASKIVGSGSTTNAVDLATAEVAGTLPAASVGNGLTDAQVLDTITAKSLATSDTHISFPVRSDDTNATYDTGDLVCAAIGRTCITAYSFAGVEGDCTTDRNVGSPIAFTAYCR